MTGWPFRVSRLRAPRAGRAALAWLVALWAALLCGPPAAGAEPEAAPRQVAPAAIEVFVREGCQHCEQAKAFLARLQQEQPGLQVLIRDVGRDPAAMSRLQALAQAHGGEMPRVPTLWVAGQLIVGYSGATRTDLAVRRALAGQPTAPQAAGSGTDAHPATDSCAADDGLTCSLATPVPAREVFELDLFGRAVSLEAVGLPLFALTMGVLSGFSPCAMWVLLLMVSVLAPLRDRPRMLAVAGSFVVVEGLSYYLLTTAWLNLFLAVGLSRVSQVAVATIAGLAGLVNVKDFYAMGRGPSLSTPARARPGIYERLRGLLHAPTLPAAAAGAAVLALLVQGVDLLCSSGLLALFTRVLTLHSTDRASTYGPVALYMAGYLGVHMAVLGIGIAVLSRQRLQQRQGRWLKLLSGVVMVGLSGYLLLA